ncbi:MAG: hypothetical protein P4L57_14460 [Rhizomicrobium sp.]|nr:hypothetical protein [Rhizomicrobium sp.]
MEMLGKSRLAFDPVLERVVSDTEPVFDRMSWADPFNGMFCEFCGNRTEHSEIRDNLRVVRLLDERNATVVPISTPMRISIEKELGEVVERYTQASKSEAGQGDQASMLFEYCDFREMRGDFSVDRFREQAARTIQIVKWAQQGCLVRLTRLPGCAYNAANPSKIYCSSHNSKRSEKARRAYQRDRRFAAAYKDYVEDVWHLGINTAIFRAWDSKDYAYARSVAYHILQAAKSPARMIDGLLDDDPESDAEITSSQKIAYHLFQLLNPSSPTTNEVPAKSDNSRADFPNARLVAYSLFLAIKSKNLTIKNLLDKRSNNCARISNELGIAKKTVFAAFARHEQKHRSKLNP